MQHFSTYYELGIRYTFFVCCFIILGSSCSTLKHLDEDQALLRKNEINIVDTEGVDDWRNLKYDLGTLVYQRPNTRLLWIPRQWFHYRIDEPQDTSWWDNFTRKNLAQEPTIYNGEMTEASARKIEKYMRERGYVNATVEYEVKPKRNKQKNKVIYNVLPRERYYFDTIQYQSNDRKIQAILQEIKSESLIEKGDPVDEAFIDAEFQRITRLLRNRGYASFFKSSIAPLQADSSNFKVNVVLNVLLNQDSSEHRTFTYGDISVNPSFNPRMTSELPMDSVYNGIHFLSTDNKFYIRPKALTEKIFFKKGDLYKLSDIEKTQIQLGNLDIFQFVDVKRIPSEKQDTVLNYLIRLIPKKRMELGTSFDLNNSNNRTTSRSLIGTSASLNFKNRNTFRGGEVLNARAQGGVEINFQDRLIPSWDLNIGLDLDFPKFYDPTGTSRLLHKTGLMSDKYFQLLKEKAISRTTASYNIQSSVDFYRINIFAASFGYDLRKNKNVRYLVNNIGINFLDPSFTELFRLTTLSQNPFLQNSLSEQLFTGFLFRDLSYIYQSNIDHKNRSWSFRTNIEQSGMEIAASNGLYNIFATGNKPLRLLNGKYEFSQYLRLETEARFSQTFSPGNSFASRMFVGVASPFAYSSDVPFVKQFSVGGPYSIRGWRIRELGPGGYENPDPGSTFFQTGDFKFEMNAEFRFDIFWILKGAFFVDAGNIWTIRTDERLNSGFDNFFDEIAVSSGLGIRLDMSLFLLRFDVGYKIRSPFPDATGRNWLVRNPSDLQLIKGANPNIALGYPF